MLSALGPILLACGQSASAAAQPTLDHTAPFLGHALALDVAGAAPMEPAVLYYGPRRGATSTPFGTFEIERSSARLVARTTTDPLGRAHFSVQVPAAASFAENEAHFQALIDDPSVPSGRTFSQGVHVRLMGTRVYCDTLENGTIQRSGMEIVSPLRDEVVASFPFAAAGTMGRPVFRRNFSVGAVIAEGNVVLFEPFFGSIRARIPLGSFGGDLLEDAGGERFYVLENSGRITAVEFVTGQVLGFLDLPVSSAGPWCENDEKTEAYVGVSGGSQIGPAVQRVDLPQLADLGAIPVGGSRQGIYGIEFADRRVVVATGRLYDSGGWPHAYSTLSVVDLSGPQPVVWSEPDNGFLITIAIPSPAADRILLYEVRPNYMAPPELRFRYTSFSHASPPADVPGSGGPPPEYPAMIAQDAGVWISFYGPWDNPFPNLNFLDLGTLSWTHYPFQHWYPGPADLATARDGYVDDLYLAISRGHSSSWPPGQEPELFVVDHSTNGERHIPLQHSPVILRAVEVP